MNLTRAKIILATGFLSSTIALHAQEETSTLRGYEFTTVVNNEAMPVQNQSRTGTCWSFSALSFFESELMRMGKGKINLSEMFIVRNAYVDKAEKYVRMHGNINFAQGGAFHDIPWVIKRYGIVPESEYSGLSYGLNFHNHGEMEAVLKGMVDAVIENKNKKLTPVWKSAVAAVVDTYLGEVPEEFEVEGKTYTPQSYAEYLDLDMDNYVSLTSFTHHPLNEECKIAVPDNWVWGSSYNVSLDDMMATLDEALENGYTVAWGADVSEKGFNFRKGLAIVPEDVSTITTSGSDSQNFSDAGAEKSSNAFDTPVDELEITPEVRQMAYDNYETQDDHGMHITGILKDQNGTKYYIIKNSWGTKYNGLDGYFYASEAYVRYKTLNIYLHKEAIPKKVSKKISW